MQRKKDRNDMKMQYNYDVCSLSLKWYEKTEMIWKASRDGANMEKTLKYNNRIENVPSHDVAWF